MNLTAAKLSEADLTRANLSGAVLNQTILDEAILRGTNLSGANLSNTRWRRAVVDRHTMFSHAFFSSDHRAMADYSETIRVDLRYWVPTWSKYRWIGRIPVFGASWGALGLSLALVNLIGFVNKDTAVSQWVGLTLPFPPRTLRIIISSVLLVVGATIYRLWCPPRVQEFSETEWVEAHGHPRPLYLAESLRLWWLVWPASVLTLSGGLLAIWLMGDFLWTAVRYLWS